MVWTTFRSHPQRLLNIGLLLDYFCKPSPQAQQRRACGTRRKPLQCKALIQCGKQDLNLHDLAATRPSTGGGIFHKSLWHNDKRRRYKDLDCVSFPVVPPHFRLISFHFGGAVGALLALGFGAILS